VSTSATLTSTCTTGVATQAATGGNWSFRHKGQGQADAYELTLTNTSAATANVTGWGVVFYDAAGNEITSDNTTPLNTSQFITSGQSYTWLLVGASASTTSNAVGDDHIPAGAASCQLVQWTHG
jgi:hypothetical protein